MGEADRDRGWYRKYSVERENDPTGKHRDCEYFVLDLVHDTHAPAALRAYAESCAATHPYLAKDLLARFGATQMPRVACEHSDTIFVLDGVGLETRFCKTCHQRFETRALDGALGERNAIADFIRAIPTAVIDDWGLNAASEIRSFIADGTAAKGAHFWEHVRQTLASPSGSQSDG